MIILTGSSFCTVQTPCIHRFSAQLHAGKPEQAGILTGSQLPIGMLRTDGKENLITSIEIAAAKHPNGTAIVPEVCIFFENHLLRGNRTTKINAENFNAFRSYNFPSLATAGIHIKYEYDRIHKADPNLPLKPHYLYDTNVIILTLFPGIQENMISNILHTPGLRAVVLKTYGSGNAPQKPWFIELLRDATSRGIIIVNISQCSTGTVEMEDMKPDSICWTQGSSAATTVRWNPF